VGAVMQKRGLRLYTPLTVGPGCTWALIAISGCLPLFLSTLFITLTITVR
jgi:hypothetical protein